MKIIVCILAMLMTSVAFAGNGAMTGKAKRAPSSNPTGEQCGDAAISAATAINNLNIIDGAVAAKSIKQPVCLAYWVPEGRVFESRLKMLTELTRVFQNQAITSRFECIPVPRPVK